MSFNVRNNLLFTILLYSIAFGVLIGSGSLYRYAYNYNLLMFVVIVFVIGAIFYQFFLPTNSLTNKYTQINFAGLILLTFFIFIPILSDLYNQVNSYEITYFHLIFLLIIFLLGSSTREKILSYYLHLMVIFSFISLIYFTIELFSEIPSFLPYYGIPQGKLSHFYYVWSRPVSRFVFVVRNQSIFWEPGAFGFHLMIATLLAFKINNKLFISILVLSCITTLSTTVYIFLFFLIIYKLIWGENKFKFIGISIFSGVVILIAIKLVLGNLNILLFMTKIITDKFFSSSSAFATLQERTMFVVESIKLFFDNFVLGAGHYATAEELTHVGSETSMLAGLLAEMGLLGIFSIILYIRFFKYFKILSIPIVLIWLNGEYMPYTAISLFILTHMVDDISNQLFPSFKSSGSSIDKLNLDTTKIERS